MCLKVYLLKNTEPFEFITSIRAFFPERLLFVLTGDSGRAA